MRKYTKMIAGVFCALALALGTSAFAADTVSAGSTVSSTPSTSLFNAGEIGLTLGTGYVVDRSAPFQGDYAFNLTAGAFAYPTKYLGAEVNVPFYQTKGVAVSEVQAGLLLRAPLSSVALLKNVAPYVGFGGVYNWNSQNEYAYIGKVGVDFRLNKKWGVFAEGQYRNNEFSNWDKGSTSVQGGLRLVF